MYLVTAVFNQVDLQDVLLELFSNNIEGVTVTDVVGKGAYGLQEWDNKPVDLFKNVKIEIVVSDELHRDIAIDCIKINCNDLGRGAGKLWWIEVGGVERIRTGEKDAEALTTQIDKKIPNQPNSPTIYTRIIDEKYS
jgi:nitrogen regulatory protein PII